MTRTILEIKPILPGRINEKAFMREIRKAVEKSARMIIKDFGIGTKNWSRKPSWTVKRRKRRSAWVWRVQTGDTPFVWVEMGTKSRKRYMSKNWASKTQPGRLHSGVGAGTPDGFTRSGKQLRGITARNFRVLIADKQQPLFARQMARAILSGASQLFSGSTQGAGRTRF